jgi:hypothetical protein
MVQGRCVKRRKIESSIMVTKFFSDQDATDVRIEILQTIRFVELGVEGGCSEYPNFGYTNMTILLYLIGRESFSLL